jgi:hypothetical protein
LDGVPGLSGGPERPFSEAVVDDDDEGRGLVWPGSALGEDVVFAATKSPR